MINLSHITRSLPGMAHPLLGNLGLAPQARTKHDSAIIVMVVDKLCHLWDEVLLCETRKLFQILSDTYTGNLILV